MRWAIVDENQYLRADLLVRETAAETQEFLHAVAEAALKHPSSRVLIRVHAPRAIFKVEQYQASKFLEELARRPSFKVAIVAKHFEVRLVHQYLALLARQKGANLRSFSDEPKAIQWLTKIGDGKIGDGALIPAREPSGLESPSPSAPAPRGPIVNG